MARQAKRTNEKRSLLEEFVKAATSNTGRVHIVPSNSRWAVKKEGAMRATVVKDTKESAVKAAYAMSSVEIVVIHKKDGSIEKNVKRR